MKVAARLFLAGLLILIPLSAQVVITSFPGTGDLTWTNPVSNGTYRVEWAPSAAGPWNAFDALTNLTSLSATSNVITVRVPMAYRIVWTDAPAYAGTYDFREYDLNGTLVVTGRLCLWGTNGAITGTRDFHAIPGSTNVLGPQLGIETVRGGMGEWSFSVDLNPQFRDNNVFLNGYLVGNTILGLWYWVGEAGFFFAEGTFTATKENAARTPAPADPAGVWDYQAVGPAGMLAKGQLGFSSDANSISGTWAFNPWDPSLETDHLLGTGTFSNAVVLPNSVSVTIAVASNSFTMTGPMSGGLYAGFCRWSGTLTGKTGVFLATKRVGP